MIEFIPIDQLSLLEDNPRRITKDQFDKLCKSLREDPDFFKARPCLVNKIPSKNVGYDLIVYAGNQRVRAASKLKWTQVPCIIESNLSKALMDSRVIKDNRSYGEFDYDLLLSNYDDDLLIDCGFTLDELKGYEGLKDLLGEEGKTEPDVKEKKQKTCPECGHSW